MQVLGLDEMDEDCLFINVITPRLPRAASNASGTDWLLPVAVYLHAGEFAYGSSQDAESNWPYFAPESIVYVTLNSRLGPLGFLGSRGALRGHAEAAGQGGGVGNFGLQDQRFGLQWVQQHISCFGGDPSRVTILGESSGGSSVALHLVSPGSWGLFHRCAIAPTYHTHLSHPPITPTYHTHLLSHPGPCCRARASRRSS
jgi:carboxylesterase type B